MKVSFAEILGSISAAILKPILEKIAAMSQQVADLTTNVSSLTDKVTALKSVTDSLKAQNNQLLDATKAQAAQITDLTAQLAAAKTGQVDPADVAAIDAANTSLKSVIQTLTDTAAVDAPGN